MDRSSRRGSYQRIEGIPASPGIAIGKAFTPTGWRVPPSPLPGVSPPIASRPRWAASAPPWRRWPRTSGVPRQRVEHEHGADLAMIFDAQLIMLQDVQVRDATIEAIRSLQRSAEDAFSATMGGLRREFEKIENEYLRARVGDLKDIEQQVLVHLAGGGLSGLQTLRSNTVIVARDLLPSEAAQLARRLVTGLVTDIGGETSHTSIIARSLGLPTVVGTGDASSAVRAGDLLVVDGDAGTVHVRPGAPTLRRYRTRRRRQLRRERELSRRVDLPR